MFQNNLLMAAASASGTSLVSVGNSALFQQANSEYLSRTVGTGSQTQKAYTSFWKYNCSSAETDVNWQWGTQHERENFHITSTGAVSVYCVKSSSVVCQLITTALFRDIGWYHFEVLFDTTQSTAADRNILKVNGVRITDFTTETNFDLNDTFASMGVSGKTCYINTFDGSQYTGDCYIAEFIHLDADPAGVVTGEFDSTGLYWTPKSSAEIKALTFGDEGFYLDNTTNAETDASGNGNNFTNNNTVTTNTNTPTNQECLWNPLLGVSTAGAGYENISVFTNGNRDIPVQDATNHKSARATAAVSSGTWYWEVGITNIGEQTFIGIGSTDDMDGEIRDSTAYYYGTNGKKYNGSGTSYGSTYTTGDVIGVALDLDTGDIEFFKNNSSEGVAFTGITGSFVPAYYAYDYGGPAATGRFAEADWSYTAPAGFKALNTTNIASATSRTVSDTYDYFEPKLYTGTGSEIDLNTTNEFQPDLIWIKERSPTANANWITDSCRGAGLSIYTNGSGAEQTQTEIIKSFDSTGVTLGTYGQINTSSATYATWIIKGGGGPTATNSAGAGATPTAGSVKIDDVNLGSALAGSIAALKISANTTLGFSVGTYTGTGANATVGHGLSVAPEMVIVKRTNTTGGWYVLHESMGGGKYLSLEGTGASATSSGPWNNTLPTSSVFSLGTGTSTNASGGAFMYMAFAPSEFISLGSYEGNGNADGAFVPTINSLGIPIQPVWSITKSIDSTSNWDNYDNKRLGYNVENAQLWPNLSTTEATADNLDIVTGGLKMRIATDPNVAETYVYIAIGTPMIDTDGRILTAR